MSRAMASHSHTMSFVDVSRILSAPMTSATSYAPDATPNSALRTASFPVAQEFSTRVTGNSGKPRVSARIPDGNPSVVPIAPNHAACRSVFVMPLSTLAAHSANAIGSRSLMPSAKCSAKGVMPAPTMATFRIPPPPALPWIPRHKPRPECQAPPLSETSKNYDSSRVHFGFECITVVGNPRSHSNPAQREPAAGSDPDRSRLGAGHLHQGPHADAVEFDDHQRIRRLQPRHGDVDRGLGVDRSGARQRYPLVVGAEPAVVIDAIAGREVQLFTVGELACLPANLRFERPLVGGQRDGNLRP